LRLNFRVLHSGRLLRRVRIFCRRAYLYRREAVLKVAPASRRRFRFAYRPRGLLFRVQLIPSEAQRRASHFRRRVRYRFGRPVLKLYFRPINSELMFCYARRAMKQFFEKLGSGKRKLTGGLLRPAARTRGPRCAPAHRGAWPQGPRRGVPPGASRSLHVRLATSVSRCKQRLAHQPDRYTSQCRLRAPNRRKMMLPAAPFSAANGPLASWKGFLPRKGGTVNRPSACVGQRKQKIAGTQGRNISVHAFSRLVAHKTSVEVDPSRRRNPGKSRIFVDAFSLSILPRACTSSSVWPLASGIQRIHPFQALRASD
jgi:hypothetical protein